MNKTFLSWAQTSDLHVISENIMKNKLVLGTTDTVLGLFAATTNEGFEGLNKLKKRSDKPYLILINSTDRIKYYVDHPQLLHIENLVKRFWPGPLTLIVKVKKGLPHYLTAGAPTIAFRMPQHEGIQKLLSLTGDLFSTSANLAGEPIPETFEQVSPELMDKVACCIAGGTSNTVPSTIIDCTEAGNFKVIREGAISKEQLKL
jgi:L-threonylcarbamoyladenylate synthase